MKKILLKNDLLKRNNKEGTDIKDAYLSKLLDKQLKNYMRY